ncbi:hypothetical protein ACWGCP_40620, partial [Streptomyces niveus]
RDGSERGGGDHRRLLAVPRRRQAAARRDAERAASAATAVGIIAAHSLSGLGTVDLLRSSLGADFGWASLVAVGFAAVALVLSGIALMLRQKAVQKAIGQGPRRPARTAGFANDA